MNLSNNYTFKVAPDVVFQDVSDDVVILDLKSEQYFGLDEVGASFWHLVSSGSTFGEAVDQLLQSYEISESQVRDDLNELVEHLEEKGLLAIEKGN